MHSRFFQFLRDRELWNATRKCGSDPGSSVLQGRVPVGCRAAGRACHNCGGRLCCLGQGWIQRGERMETSKQKETRVKMNYIYMILCIYVISHIDTVSPRAK